MRTLAIHGHIGCELVDVDLAHLLAGVAEPLKIDERHRRKRKFVEGMGGGPRVQSWRHFGFGALKTEVRHVGH